MILGESGMYSTAESAGAEKEHRPLNIDGEMALSLQAEQGLIEAKMGPDRLR